MIESGDPLRRLLRRKSKDAAGDRGWPGYLPGGWIRTSTVVLIVVFVLTWWAYDTYRPDQQAPVAPQVVPPGFVPDPSYTWVPRTRLQQPPVTITETAPPSTVTETVTPIPEPTEPAPWPFCPPLCPPSPEPPPPSPAPPAPPSPEPGQGAPPGAGHPPPEAGHPPPAAPTPQPAPQPG